MIVSIDCAAHARPCASTPTHARPLSTAVRNLSIFDGGSQKMKSEYIFPTILIALDVCAAMPYAIKCNWRMMIYWLAAAMLTACVTYTGDRG